MLLHPQRSHPDIVIRQMMKVLINQDNLDESRIPTLETSGMNRLNFGNKIGQDVKIGILLF